MNKQQQNDWALLEDGTRIHISEVNENESGRGIGYYCPGENCGKPLQAYIKKNRNHRNFFRHDPNFLDGDHHCEFSNETYRHYLAKEILKEIRQIRVPQVKKFPPNNEEGTPMVLKDFSVIKASRVELETTFYINENGKIKWAKAIIPPNAKLIIRPDVTFFDQRGKPILFIELVATHDIDHEKSAKLKRFNIDTVRVKVPRQSESEIKKSFFITEYTIWEFNRLENETEYKAPLSSRNRIGVSEIDLKQRKFFRESTKCRAARIRSLIQEIRGYLGTEQHSKAEEEIRKSLGSREAEQNAIRDELEETRKRSLGRIESKIRPEEEEFRERSRDLEERVRKKGVDLERRYKSKRRELINRANENNRSRNNLAKEIGRIEENIEQHGGEFKTEEELRDIYRAEEREIEERRKEISRLIEQEGGLIEELKESRKSLEERVLGEDESNFKRIREEGASTIKRIRGDIERELSIKNELVQEEEEIDGEIIRVEEGNSELQQEYLDRAISLIQRRTSDESTPLPKDYIQLLEAKQLIDDITNVQWLIERTKAATQCFDEKVYKSWGGS